MRVIFLGHACYLVESGGRRVLTDPWLTDPIYEGQIERSPALGFALSDLPPLDAIALTHGHLDHFNAPTLAAVGDKSIPVIHPRVTLTELDANLRLLGFTNLITLGDFEAHDLDGVRVVATPSRGVLDECAYLFEGPGGRFWDGADAPQPAEVIGEIAARCGAVDLGAFSHNSFDQPALLGLPSFKASNHGPEGAARSALLLGVKAAIAGASNMRWCGEGGAATTTKVIRRSHSDFLRQLAADAPRVRGLDLRPGDAWSQEGGIERSVIHGSATARVEHDYIHAFLGTGARWSRGGQPSTADLFRRDLPARLASTPCGARYVGHPVYFEVDGDDRGAYTVDFRAGGVPQTGDTGASYGVRLSDTDWKDLFARKLSWQVLLTSDRLRVTRYRPGPPPEGLHFAYAMQAIFP